jgi:outer membrane protein TolC
MRSSREVRLAAPVTALSIAMRVIPLTAMLLMVGEAHAQTTPAPSGAPVTTGMPSSLSGPVTPVSPAVHGPTTSLADCVAIALRDNPDALTSDSEIRGAEANREEARGYFAPKLHVDANVQQWNSQFAINFGGTPFVVRDAFTWTAGVSLIQPITPLFAIYDQYKVQDLGVDVATIRRGATRREIAFATIQAYYRLLESRRLSEVAEASVVQLDSQRKQAQSQFDNGVIGKNDLLRAALALASAKQRAIQTRGQVILARGQLAVSMGHSPDEAVEPRAFNGEPPPLGEPALESAEGKAVVQRLEIRELETQIAQAHRSKAFAAKKLLPTINAIGNYTHTAGSPFQQEDAAYVGLAASWDVWDWGTTLAGVHEADARLQQAVLARRKVADQVRLEARQAFVNAQSARDALDVAQSAVSQAEENYRIVGKKFEANAATSFDMVDAEALLTQARGQVEQALYDYLIACSALQKATGAVLPGES